MSLVICRIGSLEKYVLSIQDLKNVICRIGSLEKTRRWDRHT